MQHDVWSVDSRGLGVRRLCLTFFALALSACGGDVPDSRVHPRALAGEGLHLERVGKHSLLGTFRRDGHQIQFEALYRPFRAVMPNTSSWAVRFTDDQGEDFIVEDNGNSPAQWAKVGRKKEVLAEPLSPTSLNQRDALMAGLIAAIEEETSIAVPSGCEAAWLRVLRTLRVSGKFFDSVDAPQTLEAPSDSADEHEASLWEAQKADAQGLSGTHRVGRLAPRELTIDANYEFRQEMELWSQPVRNLLEVGYRTRKHHSATITNVLYRVRGSQDPWRPYRRFVAANHGAFPGEDAMQKYADCKNFPVTAGYFAWKGECEGSWFWYHLCNDDTAYQIWHAYGNWSETNRCLGKRRDHRPWCDEPWAPQKPAPHELISLSEASATPVVQNSDTQTSEVFDAPLKADEEALQEVGHTHTARESIKTPTLPEFIRDTEDPS